MQASTTTQAAAGKYLTFNLGDEHYGLEILRVQEIVGLLPVTRIPRLPELIAGVVNLRGRVIPVVDLRLAFGLPRTDMTDRTCIIVVRIERGDGTPAVIGTIVDEVSDVANLVGTDIEDTPEFGSSVDTSFIKGVARVDERVVLLLDIDRALSSAELELVERAVTDGSQKESQQEEGGQ